MLSTSLFLAAMGVSLFGPGAFRSGLYEGAVATYAGAPLALASGTLAALARHALASDLTRGVLAASWLAGCIVVCVPFLTARDALAPTLIGGSVLLVSGAGSMFVAIREAKDSSTGLARRASLAASLLTFGGVFLVAGARLLLSAPGGPIAGTMNEAHGFRASVLVATILFAAASSGTWSSRGRVGE